MVYLVTLGTVASLVTLGIVAYQDTVVFLATLATLVYLATAVCQDSPEQKELRLVYFYIEQTV